MHRLSIPEIHPVTLLQLQSLLYTSAKDTIHICAKQEMTFQEHSAVLNIIHSLLILYNAYCHGTIVPQELNWCQWKSVAYAPRSLAETKHIGIRWWGGALPNTIGMWLWDYTSLPKGLLWTHNLSFPIDYVVRTHNVMYQADDPMKMNKPYQQ